MTQTQQNLTAGNHKSKKKNMCRTGCEKPLADRTEILGKSTRDRTPAHGFNVITNRYIINTFPHFLVPFASV